MRFVLAGLATVAVVADPYVFPRFANTTTELSKTCEGVGSKTKDTWKDNSIGEWFVDKAKSQDEYKEDIQRTIQQWGEGSDLYGFYCSPMSHCNGNFDKDECMKNSLNPRVYFVLWAIRNFNNWMVSLTSAVDNTAGIADGMAGKLVEKIVTNEESMKLSNAGATLAAGIPGSISSVFAVTGPTLGLGSGLATVANSVISFINDAQDIELESRLNDFFAVTEYIAKSAETMQKGLERYTRSLLTSTPKNGGDSYVDDPASLPRILDSQHQPPTGANFTYVNVANKTSEPVTTQRRCRMGYITDLAGEKPLTYYVDHGAADLDSAPPRHQQAASPNEQVQLSIPATTPHGYRMPCRVTLYDKPDVRRRLAPLVDSYNFWTDDGGFVNLHPEELMDITPVDNWQSKMPKPKVYPISKPDRRLADDTMDKLHE
ncbi:hypothetical protein AJ79_00352 [Helicocarpus griseus UAMH5409]|uniref:Uncharacterized protein n=1 Tax=Helicocarpus griseus UAMH5409 TaxID=1447875 RepID=A0A2B7YC17_9EURO|nr:hypothetical protein AJ79_00352 [Helicocarpus griseus UAMH5409]